MLSLRGSVNGKFAGYMNTPDAGGMRRLHSAHLFLLEVLRAQRNAGGFHHTSDCGVCFG